jgi:hypothetical protein
MNRSWIIGGVLLAAAAAAAQGYRLEKDRLEVGARHWREWEHPAGTLEFTAEGVRPRFVRAQSNAVLDAGVFGGGIRAAGSRPEQAGRLIDGLEDTFWEPDPAAPLESGWVEIDLGRVVWAKKIAVRFAAEGEGDPFLQFKVLTSNGQPAFSQGKALNYGVAGRSEGLNKTRRAFEFELKPGMEADPGLSGDQIRFLQVVATASDQGRAEEIDQARWNSLPEEDRGEIRYFRRQADGSAVPVDRAEYEAIADPAQRSPARYFRRERPRLAEVEVWTAGDNISLGALDRGGRIVGYGNLGAEPLIIDGDYTTSWSVETGFSNQGFGGEQVIATIQDPDRNVFFDLGAWYWVNRAVLVFGDAYSRAFPNYTVTLSDGRRAPDGSFVYLPLASRGLGNAEGKVDDRGILFQDNSFPLNKARYFKLDYHIVNYSSRPAIRELQLYGQGFLPQVVLSSGLIELGSAPRILSRIFWEAETPPGTQLQLRTRTGNQTVQEIHYFNKSGGEVTEAQYRKLLSFQRGDTLISVIPGSDWSNWSQFYQGSGTPVASPSPRRYAMIEATLRSDDPDQAAQLRQVRIGLDDPLASQLIGEIAPRRLAQAGQRQTFTLYLRPILPPGSRGFDQVLVALPPGARAEVVDAAVGGESEVAAGGGRVYGPEELERVRSGADSLWVRFPQRLGQEGQELVALRFAGALYLASNAFGAAVGLDSGGQTVWQWVDEGDATAAVAGGGLIVQTPFSGDLVGEVVVSPNPFTPNGDGVNEAVEFAFPVFKVQGQKALVLEVYDLGGRQVRRLEQQVAHAAGLQRLSWDGRDGEGRLVPPGLYLCRVSLPVDAGEIDQPAVAKLVACAY